MRKVSRRFCPCLGAVLALGLVAGCRSAETVAAGQAAEAQADLDQGRVVDAGRAIRKALAARDDVSDYWLLKAHIDLKAQDRDSAFADYQYVIQLDRTNLEALQALCQLGLAVGSADDVDRYADQLLLLSPGSSVALVAKGSVALARGNPDQAATLADQVLAQNPQDLTALSLKARVMINRGQYADAAALLEKTSDSSTNLVPKLNFLSTVYTQAHDRPAYERTTARLAAAAPNDIDVQLRYADLLYQDGRNDAARDLARRVAAANPGSLQTAAAVLDLWLEAGPQALDPGRIVADAASAPPLLRADYAQFANETGRPDLAIAILRGADRGDPTTMNANAKAALAYATGLKGDVPGAMAQLNAILDDARDPQQPWALLARARLFAAAHDYVHAVRDARLLVSNDRQNATAYFALADILRAGGNPDLALGTLREGVRALPRSARMSARLAAVLAAQGDRAGAAQVALDLVRAAPMNTRAAQLAQSYPAAALAGP